MREASSVRTGDLAGVRVSLGLGTLFMCLYLCLASSRAGAAVASPLGIASFVLQTTLTREVAHGPGIAGYGFVQEPYAFTQATGHPYALTSEVEFTTEAVGEDHPVPTHDPKDAVVELPPGLVADPRAVATCPRPLLLAGRECPAGTQVGVFVLREGEKAILGPIVDVAAEAGAAAGLGLEIESKVSFPLSGRLVHSAHGYGLALVAAGLPPLGVTGLQVTLWGVPAEAGHDAQRGLFCTAAEASGPWTCTGGGVPENAAPVPFLTLGTDCAAGAQSAVVWLNSWQEPGRWAQARTTLPGLSECERLPFAPGVTVRPETELADAPVGLGVEVEAPEEEAGQEDAQALAPPPLRAASVTLPQGVSIDPAVAGGVQACPASGPGGIDIPSGLSADGGEAQPAEIGEGEEKGAEGLALLAPGKCPEAALIGSAEASTPLLAAPLKGRIYLAAPACGGPRQGTCSEADAADGSLFRIYVELGGVAEGARPGNPVGAGLIVKLEGQVRANPASGQLTVVLSEAPQLPLSALTLHLNGGPHALLANPATCGLATTTSRLEAWSAPGTQAGAFPAGTPDAYPSSSYEVNGCTGVGAFHPGFVAGTQTPLAGQSSAFTASVTREDREPYLRQIQLRTPPGLSASLSGVPLCAAALASTGACPEAARIGAASLTVGAGAEPLQLQGTVYLTGPYEGAPFGLSIVVDAAAGPLNLGPLVLRARIAVDPETAALTITSDPLPQIVLGVPLRLRRVTLEIDRPGFILNPTDCNQLQVQGTIAGVTGATENASSPFAAAGCSRLPFAPKLSARTQAGGELSGHGASLQLTLASAAGQANLRALKLDLPQRLPARLQAIQKACPQAVFEANPAACPRASLIGAASAQTPIVSSTMAGPVYLVAKGGAGGSGAADGDRGAKSAGPSVEAAFPDIVLVLQSDGVRIDLTGGLYVNEKNVTSATFRSLPDVPIRRLTLTLPEGRSSILAAGAALCTKRPLTMLSALEGQNAVRLKGRVKVGVEGCSRLKRAVRRR